MGKASTEFVERRSKLESAISAAFIAVGATPQEAWWNRACNSAIREATRNGLLSDSRPRAPRRTADPDPDYFDEHAVCLRNIESAYHESWGNDE